MGREHTIEEVCEWVNVNDQGKQFIKFITQERDGYMREMDKADDVALRKIAGGIGVLQGWLDQFEDNLPPTDRS